MTTIAIDRFVTRYTTPPGAPRERVQGIVSDAVHRVLEGALERAGVPREGHLCIRDVRAVVSVALREPDGALANKVAEEIAAAIRAAAAGRSPSVVYYRSQTHALIDLAVGAVGGAFERHWAWRQLELWRAAGPLRAEPAADAVLRALAGHPTLAVAVVAHLAERHAPVVAALVTRATPDAWLGLARSAMVAYGARADLLDAVGETAPDTGEISAVSRIVARSAIARAIVNRHADLPVAPRRAIAALALLEAEPAIGGEPVRAGRTLDAMTYALGAREGGAGATARADDQAASFVREGGDHRAAAQLPAHAPAAVRANGRAVERDRPEAAGVEARTDSIEEQRLGLRDPLDRPGAAIRRRATSPLGGLLYLVNIANRIGLAQAAAADARLARRGLRWILHEVGMALTGGEAADPAVLAFAGLPPDGLVPSAEEAPATDEERDAIARICADMTRALRDLLGRDEADAEVIAFVCRRSADIVADPAWIDVRFSLDEVSTDLRRAGLDRDPGWVPWLGVAMRFIYA